MPETNRDESWNRDDDQKPGSPNRMAQEPDGAEGSSRSPKTMTDPASGEPTPGAPAPAQSDSDQRDSQH